MKNRHSRDEIEEYVRKRARMNVSFGGIFGIIFGFTFIIIGLIILITFMANSITNEFSFLIPAGSLLLGILLYWTGRRSNQNVKQVDASEDSESSKYREILLHGKIIDAIIDDISINYYFRVNSVPSTYFYLDLKVDKVRFRTTNPMIVDKYRYESEMTVYYHDQYPDTLIPYEIVNTQSLDEKSHEYREVTM